MFETFAHTADVGIRMQASSLAELYAEAGRALFTVILADIEGVKPREERTLQVAGTDRAYLLIDWLNELLFLFESQRLLLVDYDVRVDAHGLRATVRGERLDEQRHQLAHEVKAITYHGLLVEEVDGRWNAEVILDI